ncbi:MAG TPA: MBL fold metallo-hydrolase [Stellaceae bacterium]|jgi:glyoxylase-like metal-dependent hydrolase (beta-lactamase superfamily II)|nr:MBL fold metallo-hydrolase [Stellaceae bacterium]
MDGNLTPLQFPVAAPPGPGETLAIAPGVHWLRMPLPFALDHINLWLLEDGAGWTIVDTGYATAQTRELWERIFAERLDGWPVTRVIVTHYHPDHIGLADWLVRHWQAPLWVTEKEWLSARVMSHGAEDFASKRRSFARRAGLDNAESELFSERENSYRRGVPSVPASFRRLADGMAIEIGGREWRVIVGEGHAPELACLYCAQTGVLIAGDQVLPRISPNISVQAHEPDGDPLARYLASLDKLRDAVPPETLTLPSHNLPFFGLHTRIESLAAHHRARCGEVIAACGVPKSALDMVKVLFRRALDRHQMGFALGEALAHLNFLMYEGALDRVRGEDGVDRFIRASQQHNKPNRGG